MISTDLQVASKATMPDVMAENMEKRSRVATNLRVANDHIVNDAINKLSGYVDQAGSKSTSTAGFKIQINIRVRNAYGLAREDMVDVAMITHSAFCLQLVERHIDYGIKNNVLRDELKRGVYRIIEQCGQQYAQITGGMA